MSFVESVIIKDSGGTEADVTASNALKVDGSAVAQPITDNAGSLTIDNPVLSIVGGGTEAAAQRVTIANDSTGVLSVDDNGSSLTIDNSTLAVIGGGTEAAAMRVTIATDSTGVLSVDDNGGSITVDGTVTASAQPGVDIGDVTINNASGASAVNIQDGGNSITIDNSDLTNISGTTQKDNTIFAPGTSRTLTVAFELDDVAPSNVTEGFSGAGRMSANRSQYTNIRDGSGNERGANVTAANELNVIATAQPGVDIGDVTINNASGASAVNIQDGGNSITVDGTVGITGSVTVTGTVDITELPAAAALTDNFANPTTTQIASMDMVWDGAAWDRLIGDSVNGLFNQESVSSFISTANSSSTPLAASAVFTGTAYNILNASAITIAIYSDVASATDGLQIQQSTDGTNWDIQDTYSVPAMTGKTFGIQATCNFFRIIYTNGLNAQTAFRLQSIVHKYEQRTSSIRPQDARSNDNDMTETVSYLSGFNGTSWDRLRSSIPYGLQVEVTKIDYDDINRRLREELAVRAYYQNMIGMQHNERYSPDYGYELR